MSGSSFTTFSWVEYARKAFQGIPTHLLIPLPQFGPRFNKFNMQFAWDVGCSKNHSSVGQGTRTWLKCRFKNESSSSLKFMPWWDMVLLLFVKGIIQEFKQQIDTNSNKFNHTKTKKHCTLGKDDAQIEFLIVSQRFLHVIQELMHSSMNPCISPSLLLHKLNFSFNDVTLTQGPGGRRAHDWPNI